MILVFQQLQVLYTKPILTAAVSKHLEMPYWSCKRKEKYINKAVLSNYYIVNIVNGIKNGKIKCSDCQSKNSFEMLVFEEDYI